MAIVQGQFGEITASTKKMGRSAQRASFNLQVNGVKEIRRALNDVSAARSGPAADAYEKGIRAGAERVAWEIAVRAPGSMGGKTKFDRMLGRGVYARGVVAVNHPGARSMEFGRKYYWVGYTGRQPRTGRKVLHHPGQVARPFVGVIKGDQALGSAGPYVARQIGIGIERAWIALAFGGVSGHQESIAIERASAVYDGLARKFAA